MRDSVIKKLGSEFQNLTLDKRYDYLESLGLPDFVVQTVEIESEAEKAAASVYDYVNFNSPEYLQKLPN